MLTIKSTRIRIWVSLLLLCHLVAILLPASATPVVAKEESCAAASVQSASVTPNIVHAADEQVNIPKNQVDSAVYIANWRNKFKDAEAVENLIFTEFIMALSPSQDSNRLQEIMDGFHNKYEKAIPPSGLSDAASYDAIIHTMMDTALKIPELAPLTPRVWNSISDPKNINTGTVGAPTEVAASMLRYNLTNRLVQSADKILQAARLCSERSAAAAKAIDKQNSAKLKSSIRDSAKQIIAQNPDLPMLQEIRDRLGADGSISISLNELKDLSKTQFAEIDLTLEDIQQTLSEIDAKQDVLVDYINNQQEKEKMQALAAAAAAKHKLELEAAQSGLFIVSSLAGFIDQKAGKDIAVVGSSAIEIAESMNRWLDAVAGLSTLDKITSLSTVVMTGNVLEAVMNVVSLFGDAAPTPDQVILEEIGKLRQDVSQLRTEMHDRFDRVDKELNTIYSTMQDRFNQIDIQLGKLNVKIDELQKSLLDLDNKLSRIERDNFEFLDALGRRPLLEAINGGLRYQTRTGQQMPFQPDFVNYENIFQTWGTIHAFDALATGPSQRDYSAGALLTELNAFPLDSNINYLNGWLSANGYPALSNKRLASPRDWLFATRAYNQLGQEWPQSMKQIDPQRQAALDAVGADLEAAMHNISTRTTLTTTQGNSLLFSNVITYYQNKLDRLDASIQAGVESAFLQEVRANRLQRKEPFDLYGGFDQALTYQPPELSIMTCGGTAPLPAPANLKALVPNFNRYNLAEYLKLGAITTCVSGELVDRVLICPPKQPDLCEQEGDLQVFVRVYFANTPVTVLSIDAGGLSLPEGDNATHYVKGHWFPYKTMFETGDKTVPPAPDEVAERAALLAKTTAALQNQLAAYQQELDGRVVNELAKGSLHPFAVEVAGSKALLDSFVTLGLPRAVNTDDFVHAMLYGDQQLMEDNQIEQAYAVSATLPLTATNILVNPRLVIAQKVAQRKQAFAGLINHYLAAITAQTHTEAVDYIADARRELDLTVRIAKVEVEQSAPTPTPPPVTTPVATPSTTPVATPAPSTTPPSSAASEQFYLPLIER